MKKSILYGFLGISIIFFVTLSPLTITEVKAQEENTWTTLPYLQRVRISHRAAAVNGKIYIIGGNTVDLNEEYNPKTNTITYKTPMPTARFDFGIAVYQNKIYCFGGSNGQPLGETEVYDPQTDTWETKTPMIRKRKYVTANTIGDAIHILTLDKLHYVYYPQTDNWTKKPDMPTEIINPISAVLDGKIHVFGIGTTHLIYDPQTETWTTGEPQNKTSYYNVIVATTGEYSPKRIYIFGSDRSRVIFPEYNRLVGQSYDPKTGNWTQISDIPNGHLSGGAAVIDDRIYLVGGGALNWFGSGMNVNKVNHMYTPYLFGSIPQIKLNSPENIFYSKSSVPLKFLVNESVAWMGYSLDDQENVTVNSADFWFPVENLYGANLTQLSEGNHNLKVYVRDWADDEIISSVIFTVDQTPPVLELLYPENKTYTSTDVDVVFRLSEPVANLTYTLDGVENIGLAGNITLSELALGEYNITIYAQDYAGFNGSTLTRYFSVAEPFPTTLAGVSIATIAVIGIGLLVYFKKYRK